MTKAYSRFLTAFFCLFLGGLLVWHVLLPDRAKSETENRTLAQFPVFSWSSLVDGSYTEGVEEYFADQFPLRDSFRTLKSLFHTGVLGQEDNNGIYLTAGTAVKQEYPLNRDSVNHAIGRFQRIYEKYQRI